jgi:hypothetical protein
MIGFKVFHIVLHDSHIFQTLNESRKTEYLLFVDVDNKQLVRVGC